MENNTHKVSFTVEKNPLRIDVYIDKNRIHPLTFYPINKNKERLSDEELENLKPAFVIERAEFEVRDIRDIAVMMDEETFNEFCELWREFHNAK